MNDVNAVYYEERERTSRSYNFLQLYDAGRVQRFHTTPDYSGTPRQSLAEHSWGVAMFCHELACSLALKCSAELLRAALTHDLAEYWTADVPAHVKWEHPTLSGPLDAAQVHVEVQHGINHDDKLTPTEKRILKWADGLELFVYSRQRARAGVPAYAVVAKNIARHLRTPRESYGAVDNAGLNLLAELEEALV